MSKINPENILSIIVTDGKIIKGITKIYEGYPSYYSYYWTTLKVLGISTDDINGVNGHEIAWHHELIQVRYIEELSV